jgi:hypothetical protein
VDRIQTGGMLAHACGPLGSVRAGNSKVRRTLDRTFGLYKWVQEKGRRKETRKQLKSGRNINVSSEGAQSSSLFRRTRGVQSPHSPVCCKVPETQLALPERTIEKALRANVLQVT